MRSLRVALPSLTAGRYRLTRDDRPDAACRLTIAPPACFEPPALADGRRRVRPVGPALFCACGEAIRGSATSPPWAQLGAAAAAGRARPCWRINPLHALFNDQRERASPYYPSDRRFLDPIYLDLDRVPAAGGSTAATSPSGAGIDYPALWALKAAALETAFAQAGDPAGLAEFISAGGESLARFAAFQAIAETRPGEPWRGWPQALRDPAGAGVTAFAAAHPARVRFHQYLQWLCDQQFAAAAATAKGLDIGVCRDLAVGAAPDGAEAWASAALAADGVSIGAPPDQFSTQGQVWGLPPLDPLRLEADGYAHMGELFAANMRHAGALRVDHVLGLARQFWVPQGASGADGAYVGFPLNDLLGQLTLESHRARCLVIGEDLGTVPAGLREALAGGAVLSYRVLPFETDAGVFRPAAAYPSLALACVSTHDLPPFAGWWDGVDIAERRDLGLITAAEADRAAAERLADKAALLQALAQAELIDADLDAARTTGGAGDPGGPRLHRRHAVPSGRRPGRGPRGRTGRGQPAGHRPPATQLAAKAGRAAGRGAGRSHGPGDPGGHPRRARARGLLMRRLARGR